MRLSAVLGRVAVAAVVVGGLFFLTTRRAPKTTKPTRRSAERVFVMGFDGLDPTLTRKFMAEGKLPNLQKLANSGTFRTLGTTQPSESPVAWASFATGVNPGKHNIFDFLVRDLDTYMPDLAMVDKKSHPLKLLWGTIPIARPMPLSTRGGTSFWVTAGRDGVQSKVLTVPVTFPPEEVEHGELLAGLPLPDLRGTVGTFYYWSTDLSSFEEGSPEFGGYLKRLLFDGGVSKTYLRGPESPDSQAGGGGPAREAEEQAPLSEKEQARLAALKDIKDVNVPITVNWTENSGKVDLDDPGHEALAQAGGVERLGAPHLRRELPHQASRDDPVLHPARGQRASDLRAPGQHGPARSAHRHQQARFVRAGPGQEDRGLPDHRLGRVDGQVAPGTADRRGLVPV